MAAFTPDLYALRSRKIMRKPRFQGMKKAL